MDGSNSDLAKSLVEKIPALEIPSNMIVTIPNGSLQEQVGGAPCYIMCIDALGRLLRIPMSVLPKHSVLSLNKTVTEVQHDKQKAPIATIAPWTSPVQTSQENTVCQLQRSCDIQQAIHQQPINQQQQVNHQLNHSHQLCLNQPHLISHSSQQQSHNKLVLNSQQPSTNFQQLPEKQSLPSQKLPFINIQANVNEQYQPQPQHFPINFNHLNNINFSQQTSAKQQSIQWLQSLNFPSANNQQSINQISQEPVSVQKQMLSQQAVLQNANNISPNLLSVLQNSKLLHSKNQLQTQLLPLNSTPPKVDRPQTSLSCQYVNDLQHGGHLIRTNLFQNLEDSNNANLLLPDPKQNMNLSAQAGKSDVEENVNSKLVLSVQNFNVQLKNVALPHLSTESHELVNKPFQQVIGQVVVNHELNDRQQLSKASQLSDNNFKMSSSTSIGMQNNVVLKVPHNNLLEQINHFQREHNNIAQKSLEVINEKTLEHKPPQFVLHDNKCFQISPSKQFAFPVSSSLGQQCSSKTFSSLVLPTSTNQLVNVTQPQRLLQMNSQVLKNGLKPANIQTFVLPNNVPVNALQLHQIGGLSLSNFSNIHILASGSMAVNPKDQVLFLPSQTLNKCQTSFAQPGLNSSFAQQPNNFTSASKQVLSHSTCVQNTSVRSNTVHTSNNVDQSLDQRKCSNQSEFFKAESGQFRFTTPFSSPIASLEDSQSLSPPSTSVQQNSNVQSALSSNPDQLTAGQEYHVCYTNGLQVTAVWDGKYFKIKSPGTNPSLKPSNVTVDESKSNLQSLQNLSVPDNEDSNANNRLSPQPGGSRQEPADQRTFKRNLEREEGKYALCKRCGYTSSNYIKCETCNHLLPEDVQFVIPEKKLKLSIEPVFNVPRQNQIAKPPDAKKVKKSFVKKEAAEIVHILSSDDEECHTSLKESSDKVSSPSYQSLNISASSIPFSGFRVNIKKIYFGKISCDWLNTLTFDSKSVNLLSDTCSGSYCLSACGSEVMLVAAFFSTTKHCTHLFLQVNHSSALKLFNRLFNGPKSLYDPLSADDCVKYIVLFLDDEQTNLLEVIPRVVDSMQMCNNNNNSHPVYKTIESFDVNAFLGSVSLSGNPILLKESVIVNRKCQEEDSDETQMGDQSFGSFNGKIINLFTYPPHPATGGITVTNEDLFCLNEGEFLNDVIIDFYLKYLSNELFVDKFKNSHIFSSFFYRRLTRKVPKKTDEEGFSAMSVQQRRHAHVRTWTRHVDLFSKDFIVVPINESAHWFLAIICYPGLTAIEYEYKGENNCSIDMSSIEKLKGKGKKAKAQFEKNISVRKMPCILVFDSLSGPPRSGIIKLLRDYLQVEWDLKKKCELGERHFNRETLRGTAPECPQQTNFSDCGVYVLQYVESFFINPINDYTFPIKQPSKWFDENTICKKRSELQQLILEMQKTHNRGLDYNPELDGCIIKNNEIIT